MNVAVRPAAGTDGTIVILAAFCPTCNAEAGTDDFGRCQWCDRLIVNEDTLSAREMMRALTERGAGMMRRELTAEQTRAEAQSRLLPPCPSAQVPRSVNVRADLRLGRIPIPTHDLIAALQHCAHTVGHPPTLREYERHICRPSHRTVWRRFGSWSKALAAAGLDG